MYILSTLAATSVTKFRDFVIEARWIYTGNVPVLFSAYVQNVRARIDS